MAQPNRNLSQTQLELAQIEQASAWNEYLDATRGQPDARYYEVEPWAWINLVHSLKALRGRFGDAVVVPKSQRTLAA